jgi:hypothetical protein
VSQLIPYLCIGLLLLAVLTIWALKNPDRQNKLVVEVLEPRKCPQSEPSSPLPRDLGERIFRSRDWDFVTGKTSLDIQRIFHHERSALAISWLRRGRRDVSQAMREHAIAVRRNGDLQFATEIRLALGFTLFLALCNFLIVLVRLHGLAHTRRLIEQSAHVSARIRATIEQLLAVVDPAKPERSDNSYNGGAIRS